MEVPRVKFDIDDNNPLSGVKTISLVDEPAIESNFVFLSKEKQKFIELKKEGYKQVVAGLSLIPDKNILRYDDAGNPYYGYFTVDSIERIRNKFHKEQMTSNVNTDHNSQNYIDAYLIESFIVDSEERLADVKSKGIDDVVLGSWFVAYKIDDSETFQRVVEGDLMGFSVEIFLQKFHKVEENNINKFDRMMNKFLEKFKALLEEATKEESTNVDEKKLESAKTSDGKAVQYSVTGETVTIDGSTAADGDYTLDNGKVITVASGVLTAIADAPAAEDQKKVEEPKKEPEVKLSSSIYASYTLMDGTTANVNVSNVNEVFIYDGEKSTLAATGKYDLKEGGQLVVEDGKYVGVEGIADPKTFDDKKELAKVKAELSKTQKELTASKAEVEKLKKAPLVKPVVKTEKVENVDYSKLTAAEKFRLQNK